MRERRNEGIKEQDLEVEEVQERGQDSTKKLRRRNLTNLELELVALAAVEQFVFGEQAAAEDWTSKRQEEEEEEDVLEFAPGR